jgi:SNF family Na+-dependent transporter
MPTDASKQIGAAPERERWGSRIGLILAAAGNAIGIGNLLRFPGQAAANGGGAFMIPYVVSLLLFGLPMMWVAWTMGRFGGRHGHGTTPGIFDKMWRNPAAKYFGVVGVALPLAFVLYYAYIEAWCLGYAWFSLNGTLESAPGAKVDLALFFGEFLGNATTHNYFPGPTTALALAVVTLSLNAIVLYRGVARGIEVLAKIAIPLLFIFCVVLAVRVCTLGTIKGNVLDGLNFIWTPQFGRLGDWNVWMAAAGQIFFTLSIGFGSLECYASYLRDRDDVTLTGLSTASTNEFVEVIFGSMIAIPAAAVFFGAGQIENIAAGGTFNIGMVSMPEILRSIPGIQIFGTLWFLLLFFAAFTSSVAVAQPVMAFLQDETKLKRPVAAVILMLFWFLGTLPVLYFYKYGVLDELDFWAGTIGLVVFALIEVLIFNFAFGIDRGWKEMHRGAQVQVPRVFRFVIRYVTPPALLFIFGGWFYQAIQNNTLVPRPGLLYNVVERANYPGDFVSGTRPEWSEEEAERMQAQADVVFARIQEAVELSGRDLRGRADLRFLEDGSVQVLDLRVDHELQEALDSQALELYLSGIGYRYEAVDGGGRTEGAAATIMIEALNRAPYIWLTRLLMAVFVVAFLVAIHAIWKERSAEGGVA